MKNRAANPSNSVAMPLAKPTRLAEPLKYSNLQEPPSTRMCDEYLARQPSALGRRSSANKPQTPLGFGSLLVACCWFRAGHWPLATASNTPPARRFPGTDRRFGAEFRLPKLAGSRRTYLLRPGGAPARPNPRTARWRCEPRSRRRTPN